MATAKKAAAPSKQRSLTLWEQDMANAAKRQAEVEKPFGAFKSISLKGGILSVDDTPVPGNEMNVIILQACHENHWFEGAYNPNVPAVPSCYAFGDLDADDPEDSMVAHAEAKNRQGEACSDCSLNVMGSAEVGRGKACKNVRRMLLMTEDAIESADTIAEAEMRMLKVPVMSVKQWVPYVRTKLTDELSLPYWGVITKIKVVPDAKSQFRVLFSFESQIEFDDKLYAALKDRIKEARANIALPYPELEEAPAAPVRPAGRAAQAAMAKAAATAKTAGGKRAKY